MNYFGITAGDPCGVGSEVVLKALRRRPELIGRCIVFGSAPMLDWYRGRLGIETPLHLIDNAAQVQAGCINVVDPYPVPFEDAAPSSRCAPPSIGRWPAGSAAL